MCFKTALADFFVWEKNAFLYTIQRQFDMPLFLKKQQGFTLLELLIVVSIMAIIAGMGLMSHKGTQDYSKEQAVRIEMKQLQQAVIRYFKDQNSIKDWDGGILQTSPADIGFLIFAPTFDPSDLDSDGDLEENTWNPDYRTGWRGPYIKPGEFTTPYVSISDSSDTGLEFTGNGDPTGDGDPETGTVIIVQAKPDPFSYTSSDEFFIWRKGATIISDTNPEISRLGRPYLFFDLDTYGSSESKARIVSLGGNGIYDISAVIACNLAITDVDDSSYCSREDVCESLGDDLVLCL